MDLSMADTHVMLAMPVHRDLNTATVRSLLLTQGEMQRRNMDLTLQMQEGCSLIHQARNSCVDAFMATDCTHLFWIDSDIVWTANDFLRMIALGNKMECVCGAYPFKQDTLEFFINHIDKQITTNEYGCIPIKDIGLGFTIVQRKVIEQLWAKAPKLRYAQAKVATPSIFRCDSVGEVARGEDVAFFADVRALGYKVYLDPSITLGHVGQKKYTASVHSQMTRVEAA